MVRCATERTSTVARASRSRTVLTILSVPAHRPRTMVPVKVPVPLPVV